MRGHGFDHQRLGWSFHRLWSTNWFHNPQAEVAKLRDAYERAVAAADAASPEPEPSPSGSPAGEPTAAEAGPGHDLEVIGGRDVSPRTSP